MYAHIVFMYGDEGRDVVDRLTRTEGVVVRGATDATIAEAIEYLRQWDSDDCEVVTEPEHGTRDEVVERDGYVLAWNTGLGYVSLSRRLS